MAKRKDCYTDEQKAEIIAHVLVNVACGRPVDRIFREDDMTETGFKLPVQSTFWLWLFQDETEELSEKLVRAREFGVEALLDRAIATAETPMMGEEVTLERDPEEQKDRDEGAEITDRDGNPYDGMIVKVKKGDMIAHRRLLIETMFKAAQLLQPRKYGPKLDLTSGNKPIGVAAELEAARLRARDLLDGKLP